MTMRKLEINGGSVRFAENGNTILHLPPTQNGYANAQVDDYGLRHNRLQHNRLLYNRLLYNGRIPSRKNYPWQPGTTMRLRARFSHPADALQGTAGFGFWNAPWGDPTITRPALPQATWFFFASQPNQLPFAPPTMGYGWFAATLDVTTSRTMVMLPIAPLLLLLNQPANWRQRLWPEVQHRLGISHTVIPSSMNAWHSYELVWQPEGCTYLVDEVVILQTGNSPKGPLGFVCWIDNQFLVATANGRFKWGTLTTQNAQWLEIADLQVYSEN